MHKNVQQKVIDEIESADLSENFSISNEETKKFPYIEMVIKETMRLFPIGPMIARETTSEINLEGYNVPKGVILILSIFNLHRNEKVWGENAKKFIPERFEKEKMEKIHPYAFVPFSNGKRICLGYRYAMIFMRIFIIHFFKHFQIETSQKFEEIEVLMEMTLNLIKGFPISVSKRSKN